MGSTQRILFTRAAFMALSAPCDVTMLSFNPAVHFVKHRLVGGAHVGHVLTSEGLLGRVHRYR